MTATLTRENVPGRLLQDCLAGQLTETDALLWMVLLHTHQIRLHPGLVTGGDGWLLTFPPVTQRHAADIIAGLWGELMQDPGERSHYAYWYFRYNNETPYEVLSEVPETLLPRLAELRTLLARDERVASVTPDD
jgi:hypothetical protein